MVLEFGSYTCPMLHVTLDEFKRIRARFGDEAQWILVYTSEAHPLEGDDWPSFAQKSANRYNEKQGHVLPRHGSMADRIHCAELTVERIDPALTILVDELEPLVDTGRRSGW